MKALTIHLKYLEKEIKVILSMKNILQHHSHVLTQTICLDTSKKPVGHYS